MRDRMLLMENGAWKTPAVLVSGNAVLEQQLVRHAQHMENTGAFKISTCSAECINALLALGWLPSEKIFELLNIVTLLRKSITCEEDERAGVMLLLKEALKEQDGSE